MRFKKKGKVKEGQEDADYVKKMGMASPLTIYFFRSKANFSIELYPLLDNV